MRKIRPGELKYKFFVAKQQSTSLSIKYMDMLLHALQVMHIMITFEMFNSYNPLHNLGESRCL